MDKFYLQVNFWNLVTVNIMVIIGFAVLAFLASAMRGFGEETSDA